MLFRALIVCLGYLCFNLRDDYLILADANVYAARVIPSTGYNKTREKLVTAMLIYNKNYQENGIHVRLLRTDPTCLNRLTPVHV